MRISCQFGLRIFRLKRKSAMMKPYPPKPLYSNPNVLTWKEAILFDDSEVHLTYLGYLTCSSPLNVQIFYNSIISHVFTPVSELGSYNEALIKGL